MKTKNILITLILLIIAGSIIFLLLRPVFTGQTVAKEYYTYTKAICTDENFCQDYIVTCENKQVTDIQPITGASIQQDADWEDPRINKSKIICE
jgi:hypothetical protein